MFEFPELPAEVSSLSDEDLNALEAQLVGAFNEAVADPSQLTVEQVAQLNDLTTNIETLRTEQVVRAEAAAERTATIAELANRVNAQDGTEGEGEGESADEGEGDQADEGEGGTDAPAGGDTADPEATGESAEAEQRLAASSKPKTKPKLASLRAGAPARTRPRAEAPRERGAWFASADVPGVAPGGEVTDIAHAARLLVERKRTLGFGNTSSVGVVRMTREYPSDRKLGNLSSEEISARLRSFSTDTAESIVAAGGLCAPVNNYYEQEVISDAGRPVRDSFANFQADRGGIRWNPPHSLADVTGGVDVVTAAQDADGATKDPFRVTCNSATEIDVAAIYSSIIFGNFGSRAFPEWVEAWMKLVVAKQAQKGETLLLDRLATASTAVRAAGLVGAGRELFARLGQAAEVFRSVHRMKQGAPLSVLLPRWSLGLVQADFARTFTDETGLISMSAGDVQSLFGTRGLIPSFYVDSKTGGGQSFRSMVGGQTYTDGVTATDTSLTSASAAFTTADEGLTITGPGIPDGTTIDTVTDGTTIVLSQATTATATGVPFTVGRAVLAQFPTRVYSYLFPAGSWLHLDAGTLDVGLVRDTSMNSTNEYQIFSETFEEAALVGPESVEVALDLDADGSYAAAKSINLPINS